MSRAAKYLESGGHLANLTDVADLHDYIDELEAERDKLRKLLLEITGDLDPDPRCGIYDLRRW